MIFKSRRKPPLIEEPRNPVDVIKDNRQELRRALGRLEPDDIIPIVVQRLEDVEALRSLSRVADRAADEIERKK